MVLMDFCSPERFQTEKIHLCGWCGLVVFTVLWCLCWMVMFWRRVCFVLAWCGRGRLSGLVGRSGLQAFGWFFRGLGGFSLGRLDFEASGYGVNAFEAERCGFSGLRRVFGLLWGVGGYVGCGLNASLRFLDG